MGRLFNPASFRQGYHRVHILFDTVYVSLWKCFNAASGAVLAGQKLHGGLVSSPEDVWRWTPQAWPFASAMHMRMTIKATQSMERGG
jgi:threonine aldolase